MSSSTSNSATSNSVAPRRRHLGLTLALLAFAQLIVSVDYNIVYVALPEIGDGLGFSAQSLQWVVSAYAVVFGGFLLLGGRASDLLGRRRMFVFGLFLYAVSSLVGGLATTPGLLIAARAVQGLGGAFLFPATLSLVSTTFAEGRERNRAFSVWAGAGASGMILGSLLGGVLTDAFGWEAVFYVNVPLAGAALLLAFPLIAPDGPRESGRRFDMPGALTGTAGATLLVFTLAQGPESGWTAPAILGSGAAAVILLAIFVAIEARTSDPLMPLRLFRNRNLSAGVATTFLFMGSFGTLLYFLTVYYQNVHGYSALKTGLAFLVPMGAILIGSSTGGQIATRFGTRATMITCLVVGAVGTAILGLTMSPERSYAALVPGLVILCLAQGVIFTVMFAAAATGVAPREQGIASGMASTGQQVGSAVGLAALVAVANSGIDGLSGEELRVATSDGLRTTILVTAVAIAAMILVALNFRRPSPAPGAAESAAAAEPAKVAA